MKPNVNVLEMDSSLQSISEGGFILEALEQRLDGYPHLFRCGYY